jgi:ABC-type glycerol-3-phosphate transport system permease component
MEMLGLVLMGIGTIISLVGGIWLLVEAFKTSVWWGLGSLIVPFVSLVFAIKYWGRASRPFLISIGGAVLTIIGGLMGGFAASQPQTEALALLLAV